MYLQHHLSYACRIKKHGTLLYRSNGDLLTALSNALYKGKLKKDVTVHANATMEVHPTHHADEINALIHKQIQKILTADLTTTYRFDQIEVDVLVSEIDPQLWNPSQDQYPNAEDMMLRQTKCTHHHIIFTKYVAYFVSVFKCSALMTVVLFLYIC